jgi:hypothetical protein
MSAFMGLYAFDIQGIVYGPLLVCLINVAYQILKSMDVGDKTPVKKRKK